MGSEDLFKKRKARRLKDQQRRIGFCQSYDRVLIVCEGEQTEPLYFESFKQEYDLSSANVVVTDASKGSDPVSIIKQDNAFDSVFCVFDKDQHGNYDNAVRMLSKVNSKFTAITSVPCFEYWFSLHFEYTTKSFPSASAVISELKKHRMGDEERQQLVAPFLYLERSLRRSFVMESTSVDLFEKE